MATVRLAGVLLVALSAAPCLALNNGLALTPPCGLNSYMECPVGEAFLESIADYFIATGMNNSCFRYVNSDEGWELNDRNATTHELMWDPELWPSGLPAFTARLAAKKMKFGLYGAASGVTCNGVTAGQLGYEDLDVATFKRWGVSFLKSDNCASYAMDSSVRFAATRDALLRADAQILYSIEPFSISPDLRQSVKVANMWRVATDMGKECWHCVIDRASISDKWAPLAGPGGWNDPDMINLGVHFTAAENRAYFGLWCIMKAPLLLSANLPKLPAWISATFQNPEIVAINQDSLGVQARKLMLDGQPLPWEVGLERCDLGIGGGISGMRPRGFRGGAVNDTRTWQTAPHGLVPRAMLLINEATGRCLAPRGGQVKLLPCNHSDATQAWTFGQGLHTVSALVHNATGAALAAGNCSLFACEQGYKHKGQYVHDANPVPNAAYGEVDVALVPYTPTENCTFRNCEGYHPEQLWYYNVEDRFLEQATYTASINHVFERHGDGMMLTPRTPTFAHHCLAHVLSTGDGGTDTGTVELWGGPLSGGAWVIGLFNAGDTQNATNITAPFAAFESPGIGETTQFCVRDVWARKNVGSYVGSFSAEVGAHDLGVYKLSPGAC